MRLHATGTPQSITERLIGRITTVCLPVSERADAILMSRGEPCETDSDLSGYLGVLTLPRDAPRAARAIPGVSGVPELDHLADGDVVLLTPGGFVRVLYRRNSRQNFILLAENCNSYCLMCSQPPRPADDLARVREHLRLIDLIDPETAELGLTGGEPTLLKDAFVDIIRHSKERLPRTGLHVLTNGRLFCNREFAQQLAAIGHPNLMLGVPLYSDVDYEHDYVVQAKGAFDETVLGLYHLAHLGVAVEIRVVLHRQTYRRLPQLAEFIARNFPFAAQVALMGLEFTGLTLAHPEELWIDPADYQPELTEATWYLHMAGVKVRLYNHQLCVLDNSLWRFAVKSISDWKRAYLPVCQQCTVRSQCGGVFDTSHGRHSLHLRAYREAPVVSERG